MTFQLETALMPVASNVLFYPLFLLSAILAAIYYFQYSTHTFKLGNAIPGLFPWPIFGNMLAIIHCKNPHEITRTVLELAKPFKKIARVWVGNHLVVALLEPDDIEIILNSHIHLKKSSEYKYFKPWLGDGLLISSGEKWRAHRKMIAPTFHMNVLKSFMDVFNKNSREVCKAFQNEAGREFDVHDYMSGTTVDILLETAMGVKNRKQNKAGFDYAIAVMKMCEIIHLRQFRLIFKFDFIYRFSKLFHKQKEYLNTIHSLTKKVVKQRKEEYIENRKSGDRETLLEKVTQNIEEAERQEQLRKVNNSASSAIFKGLNDDLDEIDNDIGQKKRLAFLDFMIEASQNTNNITDTDIKEEVDTIMFEGHDTTAAGSSFTLCMLGVHQDVQEKVVQELKQIFGDSNRMCTFNDTLEMKYLERVILETLRIYPPVPVIAREITEDVQLVTDNLVLPAGSTVVIPQFLVHRRGDLYPNPMVFNPDNFLPERCQKRHYYSYFPFSAGPRSCVGRKYALLKLKVLISTIVRNFKIISDVSEEDFKLQADIILKRADGFRIRVEPRN